MVTPLEVQICDICKRCQPIKGNSGIDIDTKPWPYFTNVNIPNVKIAACFHCIREIHFIPQSGPIILPEGK